jgi:hypothetical protein
VVNLKNIIISITLILFISCGNSLDINLKNKSVAILHNATQEKINTFSYNYLDKAILKTYNIDKNIKCTDVGFINKIDSKTTQDESIFEEYTKGNKIDLSCSSVDFSKLSKYRGVLHVLITLDFN